MTVKTALIGPRYTCILVLLSFILPLFYADAAIQDEIAQRERQVEEIQKQIDEYEAQVEGARSQSTTLQNHISGLNAQINKLTLEIKSLSLSINQTSLEITDTEGKIGEASDKITKHKYALAQFIQIIYETDQKSLTEVLLKNETLSDFFSTLNSVQVAQNNLEDTIKSIRSLKTDLEDKQATLEDKKSDLERAQRLQTVTKKSLDSDKTSKNNLLKQTKGQESKFQELIKKSLKDIESIRAQIGYLEQNGVTAEEAVKYGQLAAIATGIRPAFLIAVLEVESGLGINVGKCNRAGDPPSKSYKEVMKPDRDIKPFLGVTSQLGLNPDITPVSCPQYVNGRQYGWGGAMGPAQFIPSTWTGYASDVARLVGRPIANPWIIEDAFTAAALKLARGGATAKTTSAERGASKAYYSGRSTCSTSPCNAYANAVQNKAAQIEANL